MQALHPSVGMVSAVLAMVSPGEGINISVNTFVRFINLHLSDFVFSFLFTTVQSSQGCLQCYQCHTKHSKLYGGVTCEKTKCPLEAGLFDGS